MKSKKQLVGMLSMFFVMFVFLTSPVMGQSYSPDATIPRFKALPAQVKFQQAIRSGTAKEVEELVSSYPSMELLTTKVEYDSYGKVLPICVSVREGNADVVDYILSNYPKQANAKCAQGQDSLLIGSLERGDVRTALVLLSYGASVKRDRGIPGDDNQETDLETLIICAETITNADDLKRLIPVLLNAGADPHAHAHHTGGWDALYEAAQNKNQAFVTTLANELEKRKLKVYSSIVQYWCADPSSDKAKQAKQEYTVNKDAARWLRKQGIEVKMSIRPAVSGCN